MQLLHTFRWRTVSIPTEFCSEPSTRRWLHIGSEVCYDCLFCFTTKSFYKIEYEKWLIYISGVCEKYFILFHAKWLQILLLKLANLIFINFMKRWSILTSRASSKYYYYCSDTFRYLPLCSKSKNWEGLLSPKILITTFCWLFPFRKAIPFPIPFPENSPTACSKKHRKW